MSERYLVCELLNARNSSQMCDTVIYVYTCRGYWTWKAYGNRKMKK